MAREAPVLFRPRQSLRVAYAKSLEGEINHGGSKQISQSHYRHGRHRASWAAQFLARPRCRGDGHCPNAEASLRRFVEAAWPRWTGWGSPRRLSVRLALTPTCGTSRERICQEKDRADRLQEEALRPLDELLPPM